MFRFAYARLMLGSVFRFVFLIFFYCLVCVSCPVTR